MQHNILFRSRGRRHTLFGNSFGITEYVNAISGNPIYLVRNRARRSSIQENKFVAKPFKRRRSSRNLGRKPSLISVSGAIPSDVPPLYASEKIAEEDEFSKDAPKKPSVSSITISEMTSQVEISKRKTKSKRTLTVSKF